MTTIIAEQSKQHTVSAPIQKSFSTQNALTVLLLDSDMAYAQPQVQLLSLALRLRQEGFTPRIACPPASPLAKAAKAKKFPLIDIIEKNTQSTVTKKNKKFSLGTLLRLFFVQKRAVPLCIHCFDAACLPLIKRLVALRKKHSTVVLHSCFALPILPAKQKVLATYWQLPEKIICSSAYMRNAWAEAGIDPARLSSVHCAHIAAEFTQHTVRTRARFIFLTAEDLCQGSGVDLLLKAMLALWGRTDLPEWEIRVVGEGALFTDLLEEAKALGVDSRLALLGKQPLPDMLEHADVFISPHTNADGNIVALMAAWCAGIPLLCTSVQAHMEVVRHEKNAFTLTPADPHALIAAMIRLMQEKDLRQRLAHGSAIMRTYANIPRLEKQYLALYRDCIGRQGWLLPTTKKTHDTKQDKTL